MPAYPKLMRLTNYGQSKVTEEFLKNPDADPISEPEALQTLEIDVPLDDFNRVVTEAIGKFGIPIPPSADAETAVALHKALKIPRRIAMDKRVWQFLSCVARPDYTRARWTDDGAASLERFLGGIKRNAFARLWWGAEVMRDGSDYSQVGSCFEPQDLYEAVFGRSFSKFPPAAKGFIGAVKGEHRNTIREVAKDFNLMLSTFVVEDLAEERIKNLVGIRVPLRQVSGATKR